MTSKQAPKQESGLTVGRVLLRYVAGKHYDGRPRSDATFFRDGTQGEAGWWGAGRESRWVLMAGWKRAGLRLVMVVAAAGLWKWRAGTEWALAIVGGPLAGASAWRAISRVQEMIHFRTYVRPLHDALAAHVGVPLITDPRDWLDIPRGFASMEGPVVRVELPAGFLAREQGSVVAAALVEKLGLEDGHDISFQTVGPTPVAVVSMTAPPPARVSFADVRDALEAAPESAPVIGIGPGGIVIDADLEADSPHILMSAGSGGGKSATVRAIFAQGLHKGALGVVLDVKRMSLMWARGLPNILYCRVTEEVHETLLLLKEEIDRRSELADELADENGDLSPDAYEQVGPRLYVVAEEMNATTKRLAAYWKKIKAKSDPPTSPAIEALNDILFMGRQVRVNVIALAQMGTAAALGGPEARENFATRILARYTVNAWRMLCPEVWPMPRRLKGPGGVQVVKGGHAYPTRVVFFTGAQARAYATSGVCRHFGPLPAHAPRPELGLSHPQIPRSDGAGTPGTQLVTLRQATAAGVLTVSLESARAARKRDPEFPAPGGQEGDARLYDPAELARWERNRCRSAAS